MTDGFHPCADYRSPSALGAGGPRRSKAPTYHLYNSREWEDDRGQWHQWCHGTYPTRKAAEAAAAQAIADCGNHPDWAAWWIEES